MAETMGIKNEQGRDCQFDTIKGLMILLVVFCHVFNVLYSIPSLEKMLNIFLPRWTLWYLLSLFFWKIMVEVAVRIKYSFLVSLGLALYAGFLSSIGGILSLSRTFCFFPFFLAGYLCQKDRIDSWRRTRKNFSLLAVALAVAISFVFVNSKISYKTLLMNLCYKSLRQSNLQGVFLRGLILLAGFLCIFALITIIPQKRNIFSVFGRYSITIYLGHSLLIRILEYVGVRRILRSNITNPWFFCVIDIAFSVMVCFLLGNEHIAGLYRRSMEKVNTLLLK